MTLDGLHYSIKNLEPSTKPQNSQFNNFRYLFAGNQPNGQGFQGCIGTYRFNNLDVPLEAALGESGSEMNNNNEVNHMQRRRKAYYRQKREAALFALEQESPVRKVQSGCHQLATCQSLGSSYCPLGQICQDFWKGPFCVCPVGNHASLGPDGTLSRCNQHEAIASIGISRSAVALIILSLLALFRKF